MSMSICTRFALSIVTNKPGNANLGPLSLVGQSLSKDFWG